MIEAALNKAFDYFGILFMAAWAYFWLKFMIGLVIEEKGAYHSTKQKIIRYFLAILIAGLFSTIIGFMIGKSLFNGLTAFFFLTPIAIFATFRMYNEEKDRVNKT